MGYLIKTICFIGLPLASMLLLLIKVITLGKYPRWDEGFAGVGQFIGYCYFSGLFTILAIVILL